jgi:hypothetical protein
MSYMPHFNPYAAICPWLDRCHDNNSYHFPCGFGLPKDSSRIVVVEGYDGRMALSGSQEQNTWECSEVSNPRLLKAWLPLESGGRRLASGGVAILQRGSLWGCSGLADFPRGLHKDPFRLTKDVPLNYLN